MAKTLLNRNIRPAHRLMEGRQDELGLAQIREIKELKEQIFLAEEKIRRLERENSDYQIRERKYLEEIEDLSRKLRYNTRPQLHSSSPYILMEQPMKKEGKRLDEDWDYFMYAYTDDIFIQSDKPDLLLYWNGFSYVNPNGTVMLPSPVTQKILNEHNILKVRPLTEEELDDITTKFNLR